MSASRRLLLQACVVLTLGVAALLMPEPVQARTKAGCTFCLSICPSDSDAYCLQHCPEYPAGACVASGWEPCEGTARIDCDHPQ